MLKKILQSTKTKINNSTRKFSTTNNPNLNPQKLKILDLNLEKKQLTYNRKRLISSLGMIYGCSGVAFYLESIIPAFGIAILGFFYSLNYTKNPIFNNFITKIEKDVEKEEFIFHTFSKKFKVKREKIQPLITGYEKAVERLEKLEEENKKKVEETSIELEKKTSIIGILDDYFDGYKQAMICFNSADYLERLKESGEIEITRNKEIKDLEFKARNPTREFKEDLENFGFYLKLGNEGMYYIGFTYSNFVEMNLEIFKEVLAGNRVDLVKEDLLSIKGEQVGERKKLN